MTTEAVQNESNLVRELPAADLSALPRYINRELSWLRFNERVLEEALDQQTPLLERLRFLSIFGGNMDEFFMIRVSGLRRQLETGVIERPPDGMSPSQQLADIRARVLPDLEEAISCWHEELRPRLARDADLGVLGYDELTASERQWLQRHFESSILPILTPLAFDPAHPFPHISNLSLNLAVVVSDESGAERFARLKVPATPRLLELPAPASSDEERLGLRAEGGRRFVWLEEVISHNLDRLFPGFEILASYPFRVTRDADFEIEEDEAADLLTAMAEVVEQRYFGSVVRLEVDSAMPERIREILERNLELHPYQVYTTRGPLGLGDLAALADLSLPAHRYLPFQPVVPPALAGEDGLFSAIRRRDVVLLHPYDSFAPVVELLRQAARDPQVLAIKQTLYRVGPNSPIVQTLMEARENGKQVSVLVELKARFDEENNIQWAQALDAAGVHVAYGLLGLKTHAKMLLVVRKEGDGIRSYVHLASGNYNSVTARAYSDLGLLTADPDIALDVADLFNALTGYSRQTRYRKLLVSPGRMREELIERIHREIERHRQDGNGYIAFKLNSLGDRQCIDALYRASQAGVVVDLQVRGVCCLRPGVPGYSENISVTSVVGRFLEHARLFYFRNGGHEDQEELWSGSADLLPRNLDGRFEILFPITDQKLRRALRDDVLGVYLRDNVQARRLLPDGSYTPKPGPRPATEAVNSQELLLAGGGSWRASV